jgi:glycosyltransferase involved in cell wall biosynthesis
MSPAPSISVIVTTYNRPDALEAVVDSLFAQTDRDVEIIIADDGSGPATFEAVARLQARATLPLRHVWQSDEGFRLSMARNGGIRAARGDYILILDGDCVTQRDYVAQHRRLARRGCMVTGSRILLDAAFTAQVLAGRRDLQSLTLADKLRLRAAGHLNKVLQLLVKLPDIGRTMKRFRWRRIKGCNLAIWRSDLERIGGFDESFTGWGHEDADAVLRLHNAGVLRRDGAFATEVFHLWHREAQRDQASSNKRIVEQRLADGTVLAIRGLQHGPHHGPQHGQQSGMQHAAPATPDDHPQEQS